MRLFVEGIGLLGPGLPDWAAGRPVLAGERAYVPQPVTLTASVLLPAVERRRSGVPVKLALAVGQEACQRAGRDMTAIPTVFTSSGGDGDNVHAVCDILTVNGQDLSPTRFHNSVHNAVSGYWGIAVRSHEPSTSLCAYDASFAAGLLEAVAQVTVDGRPVALIAYDHPYPEPLHAARPIGASFATALVLVPEVTEHTFARLTVNVERGEAPPTTMAEAALEALRRSVPAARGLPLLAALGRAAAADLVLEYGTGSRLHVAVAPC